MVWNGADQNVPAVVLPPAQELQLDQLSVVFWTLVKTVALEGGAGRGEEDEVDVDVPDPDVDPVVPEEVEEEEEEGVELLPEDVELGVDDGLEAVDD